MAIFTRSAFRYGWVITDSNFIIDIDEGLGAVSIELNVGSYTPTSLITELSEKLNTFLSGDYTVSFDRVTRRFTISEDSATNFDILFATGPNFTRSVAGVIGYTAVDLTGASSYESDLTTGVEYRPQFPLQSYIPFDDWKEANFATVNESASGILQVVKYGDNQFMQANIKYIFDKDAVNCSDYQKIEANPNALDEARAFLDYATSKGDLEFIPDRDDPSTFDIVILERTRQNSRGTGYRLNPVRGLYGYRETGTLRFRKKVG